MAWTRWHKEGGSCNIDELSAAGMTHLELEMKKESIKARVQVVQLFFFSPNPQIIAQNFLNGKNSTFFHVYTHVVQRAYLHIASNGTIVHISL